MTIETDALDSAFDQILTYGSAVIRFFSSETGPDSESGPILGNDLVWGTAVLGVVLALVIFSKWKKANLEKQRRMEELARVLDDSDIEDQEMPLWTASESLEEEGDWEDGALELAEPEQEEEDPDSLFLKDAQFGNQIVISPKTSPAENPSSPALQNSQNTADQEIEREFQLLEEELKRKGEEFGEKHELNSISEEEPPGSPAPEPFALSMNDMVVDSPSEETTQNLVEPFPLDEEEDPIETLLAESDIDAGAPAEPLPFHVDEPSPRRGRVNSYIQKLEHFERDLDQQLRSPASASTGNSKNGSEDNPEYVATMKEKQDTLKSLESFLFIDSAKRRRL